MAIRNNTWPSQNNEGPAENVEQLRANLRQRMKRYAPVLDILLDAYCVVDRNNQVVDFNVAFTELCGETYRKIKKIGSFCSLLHTELCPDNCPAKQTIETGKPLRLDEISGSSKAFPELQMILGAIPIFADDNTTVIGSLLTIRNVTAESLLQKKYDERKKESIVDGLTRIFNKVTIEEFLLRMIKSTLRDSQSMSVVMCDLDHFKKINDTYGHQAGDHVLYRISQLLKNETRETDAVGRFGGEEFLAVLAKNDMDGARIFAERFRSRVEATSIVFEGKPIPVTVSLGTATFSEQWRPGLEVAQVAKDLVQKADTALYFAKANGRNRTCQFEQIPVNKKTG